MDNTLRLYAYAPSLKECEKHNKKFPSLSVKKVTQNAINCGAFEFTSDEDYKGNGYFYTRTLVAGSASHVYSVGTIGVVLWGFTDVLNAGACVGITTIYDPESSLVKGASKRNFTRTIFNEYKGIREEVTDKNVPIVKFGDHEYIWYNKKECESGENPLMDLVILDMPECAKPLDKTGYTNEYFFAIEQQEQYERIALAGTNEEERNLLVQMSFSSNDRYEKGTPVYTKEQEEIIERVKASFEPQN